MDDPIEKNSNCQEAAITTQYTLLRDRMSKFLIILILVKQNSPRELFGMQTGWNRNMQA